MTEQEFEQLCDSTAVGTPLSFHYRDKEVRGKFIGCMEDAVIIETSGGQFIWPRQLCDAIKSTYPRPSYS